MVFRSFLQSEETLKTAKIEFIKQVETIASLRQSTNTALSGDVFEEFMLPPFYEEAKLNYSGLDPSMADEVLEKYAILSFLVSTDILKFLNNKVDYFSKTIFSRILSQKYPKINQVKSRFYEIRKKYLDLFAEFHNKEIDRILVFETEDSRTGFSKSFIKTAEKLIKSNTKPLFVHSIVQQKEQRSLMMTLIFKKIESDLLAKIKHSKVDFVTLVKFRQFLEGNMLPANIAIAKKLFVEANDKLGFFELNQEFRDQRHFIIKAMFRSFVNTPVYLKKQKEFKEIQDGDFSRENFEKLKTKLDEEIQKFEGEESVKMNESEVSDVFGNVPSGQITEEEIWRKKGELIDTIQMQIDEAGNSIRPSEKKILSKKMKEIEKNMQNKEPEIYKKLKSLPEEEQIDSVIEYLEKNK